MRINIASLQHTKPFMPPFAGTPTELEALVQLLGWTKHDRPKTWPLSEEPETIDRIRHWLDQAGTEPALALGEE